MYFVRKRSDSNNNLSVRKRSDSNNNLTVRKRSDSNNDLSVRKRSDSNNKAEEAARRSLVGQRVACSGNHRLPINKNG